MAKRTNFQRIKLLIKISIVVCVLSVFIVIGIFMRPTRTFENANMGKWLSLNKQQRIFVIERIIKDNTDNDLLIKCIDKIAGLPKSNEMAIRDAVALCYNGIKINASENKE